MLGFKFIDTLEEHGLKGPVPVFGVFGGTTHIPNINYQSIFNKSIVTEILVGPLSSSLIGKSFPISLINQTNSSLLSRNLITNSELFDPDGNLTETGNSAPSGWQFTGQGAGGTEDIIVELGVGDDLMESPYTTLPAKKVSVTGTTMNGQLYAPFNAETDDIVTLSCYLSYGSISSHPNATQEENGPRTNIKIDDPNDNNNGSDANLWIKWNDDDTISLTSSGSGSIASGYDTLEVGGRKWFRVWVTGKLGTAMSGSGRVHFWPTGWVDTSNYAATHGHVYVAHFQLEVQKSGNLFPSLYEANYDPFIPNRSISNIIVGQSSTNMVAPLGTNQIVYDALTNKPFTDYTKGRNKIYFSAEDAKNKYLVYRDNDFTGSKVRLLKPNRRFHNTLLSDANGDHLYIHEAVTTSISYKQDPAHEFELSIPIRDNKHSWKIQIKKTQELYENNIIKITGGSARPNKVWNEKPEKLTSKLFKLSQRGLARWKYDRVALNADPNYHFTTFYGLTGGLELLLNYEGYNIADIDIDKGLVLFENQPPEDIEISYCVSDSWFELPIELNPLLSDNIPESIEIKVNKEGRIVYELDGSGVLIDNGEAMFSLAPVYHEYKTLAVVSMKWGEPEIIDIRREGGMLIDQENSSSYDIDSHVTYGFMGVNPTQLAIVRIPDKALENLIYQWEDTHMDYNSEAPFSYPLDWANNRQDYIAWLAALPVNDGDVNLALLELLMYVKRFLPIGIGVALFDKEDNYIGRSA